MCSLIVAPHRSIIYFWMICNWYDTFFGPCSKWPFSCESPASMSNLLEVDKVYLHPDFCLWEVNYACQENNARNNWEQYSFVFPINFREDSEVRCLLECPPWAILQISLQSDVLGTVNMLCNNCANLCS